MKICKANMKLVDKNTGKEIATKGQVLLIEDDNRADESIKAGVVTELDYVIVEGAINEKKAEDTEDYSKLTVDEIKKVLDEKEVEYKEDDKKKDLLAYLD